MSRDRIVVVGGGLAALRAAERLRELGFGGSVAIVADEARRPYSRPALSKQLLDGTRSPDELELVPLVELEAEMRLGQRAVGLDVPRRLVRLAHGEELPYDGLIVATGVRARRLPGVPEHDDRVLELRTLDDALALAGALQGARHLVVVGGGFIGCEVASSARRRAINVTLVDVGPTLLGRVLGASLGPLVAGIHEQAGVRLRLGTAIRRWRTGRRAVHLQLDDGSELAADAVVVGVGTQPCVEWLAGTGVDVSDGVLCDATCHIEGLDDAVAAGDVARWPNLRFGAEPRRVEHWIHAVEHGRAAAESLLQGRDQARPFSPVPRFWSEQHGVKIQAVGMPSLTARVALAQGSLEQARMVAVCLDEQDRLIGAIGLDSPRAMLRYAEMVDRATAGAMRPDVAGGLAAARVADLPTDRRAAPWPAPVRPAPRSPDPARPTAARPGLGWPAPALAAHSTAAAGAHH